MMPTDFIVPPGLLDNSRGRRQYRRFAVSLRVIVWQGALAFTPELSDRDLALATQATATTLSLTGMSFRSDTAFKPGARLWMRVWLEQRVLLLPSQVRHTAKEMDRGRTFFRCDVQFHRSPSTEEAMPVLAKYLLTRPAVT